MFMTRNCDSCGFWNAMMEGCGNPAPCHSSIYEEPSGWIPISQRRVLSPVIRDIPEKKRKNTSKKHKNEKQTSK